MNGKAKNWPRVARQKRGGKVTRGCSKEDSNETEISDNNKADPELDELNEIDSASDAEMQHSTAESIPTEPSSSKVRASPSAKTKPTSFAPTTRLSWADKVAEETQTAKVKVNQNPNFFLELDANVASTDMVEFSDEDLQAGFTDWKFTLLG